MTEIKTAKDQVTIEDVLELAGQYIKNPDSIQMIKNAYEYVMVKHAGQKRRSGEP